MHVTVPSLKFAKSKKTPSPQSITWNSSFPESLGQIAMFAKVLKLGNLMYMLIILKRLVNHDHDYYLFKAQLTYPMHFGFKRRSLECIIFVRLMKKIKKCHNKWLFEKKNLAGFYEVLILSLTKKIKCFHAINHIGLNGSPCPYTKEDITNFRIDENLIFSN